MIYFKGNTVINWRFFIYLCVFFGSFFSFKLWDESTIYCFLDSIVILVIFILAYEGDGKK